MASTALLDMIGEVRRAKENPADFIAMTPQDQAEWVNNFLPKIEPPPTDAPAVCLLDGGVIANPLIAPGLLDRQRALLRPRLAEGGFAGTPRPSPRRTRHGNGRGHPLWFRTGRTPPGQRRHRLSHRLESARILPPRPRENERRLYGAITSQTISRVEIAQPQRNRNFCMAVTTEEKTGANLRRGPA